jgi:hypothetical protein
MKIKNIIYLYKIINFIKHNNKLPNDKFLSNKINDLLLNKLNYNFKKKFINFLNKYYYLFQNNIQILNYFLIHIDNYIQLNNKLPEQNNILFKWLDYNFIFHILNKHEYNDKFYYILNKYYKYFNHKYIFNYIFTLIKYFIDINIELPYHLNIWFNKMIYYVLNKNNKVNDFIIFIDENYEYFNNIDSFYYHYYNKCFNKNFDNKWIDFNIKQYLYNINYKYKNDFQIILNKFYKYIYINIFNNYQVLSYNTFIDIDMFYYFINIIMDYINQYNKLPINVYPFNIWLNNQIYYYIHDDNYIFKRYFEIFLYDYYFYFHDNIELWTYFYNLTTDYINFYHELPHNDNILYKWIYFNIDIIIINDKFKNKLNNKFKLFINNHIKYFFDNLHIFNYYSKLFSYHIKQYNKLPLDNHILMIWLNEQIYNYITNNNYKFKNEFEIFINNYKYLI